MEASTFRVCVLVLFALFVSLVPQNSAQPLPCDTYGIPCDKGAQCISNYSFCSNLTNPMCKDGTDADHKTCLKFTCPQGRVKCADKMQCIDSSAICDGFVNCLDQSDEDETKCKKFDCTTAGRIPCPSGVGCIYGNFSLCDGFHDCLDGSDETSKTCLIFKCPLGMSKCSDNKQCVYLSNFCDGFKNCNDGSDESAATCSKFDCVAQQKVKCPLGYPQCIYSYQLCDGNKDCGMKGTDESAKFCNNFQCATGTSKCADNIQCLYDNSFCDGTPNCNDKSDESPTFCAKYNCTNTYRINCPLKSPLCLYLPSGICDGLSNDCPGNTDENAKYCKKYQCADDSYTKCADGEQCISKQMMCDGIIDCNDGSDEKESTCSKYTCNDPMGMAWGGDQRVSCPKKTPQCLMDEYQICDGRIDCFNGADEDVTACKKLTCPDGYMKCADKVECVAAKLFCDGNKDCEDGSDEVLSVCKNFNCSETGRANCPLGVGRCISDSSAICNGYYDGCPKNSDEDPTFCKKHECSPNLFKCKTGTCIYNGSVCNGYQDCSDGSDEDPRMCAKLTCSTLDPSFVKCPFHNTVCVSNYTLCDGYPSGCPNNSDDSPAFCKGYKCPDGMMKCADKVQCLSYYSFCNGYTECIDQSDEDPKFCAKFNCSLASEVNCPNKQPMCVSPSYLCDGTPQCPKGSDEDPKFCKTYNCSSGMLKCPGSSICTYGNFCNGLGDCPAPADGINPDEDPKFCKKFKCPDGTKKCKDGLQCISVNNTCDGYPDCHDVSDEGAKFCSTYKCSTTGKVQCPSGKYCIYDYCSICDGYSNCPDGSDELPKNCHLNKKCPYPVNPPPTSSPGMGVPSPGLEGLDSNPLHGGF